jgi:hypothetical protein
MTTKASLVEEALQAVEERGEKYGHPRENLKRIAEMWTSYLGFSIEIQDVAMMMILLKVARTVETPCHRDSLVDIVGYIHTIEMALSRD